MEIKEINPKERMFELTVTRKELKALMKGVVRNNDVGFGDWDEAKKLADIE